MRTLLENLREDERFIGLDVKVGGRYVANDIGQAIAEIERLQASNGAFRDFHNRLRIMSAIDLDELQAVGLMFNARPENPSAWIKWRRFQSNPASYLISCSDAEALKIWSIIDGRATCE